MGMLSDGGEGRRPGAGTQEPGGRRIACGAGAMADMLKTYGCAGGGWLRNGGGYLCGDAKRAAGGGVDLDDIRGDRDQADAVTGADLDDIRRKRRKWRRSLRHQYQRRETAYQPVANREGQAGTALPENQAEASIAFCTLRFTFSAFADSSSSRAFIRKLSRPPR